MKLSQSEMVPASNQMLRLSALHAAYARILAVSYFRLPGVARKIIDACTLEPTIAEKLWDFSKPLSEFLASLYAFCL